MMWEVTMNAFDAANPCPKCGTKGATFYHHADACAPLADVEHMHRTCKGCGYEWAEAPLS